MKVPKAKIVMIFRIIGNVTDPQEPSCLTLAPQFFQKNTRKSKTCFKDPYCWKFQNLKTEHIGKHACRTPSYQILEILNMGAISFKKHDIAILECFNSIEGIQTIERFLLAIKGIPPPQSDSHPDIN